MCACEVASVLSDSLAPLSMGFSRQEHGNGFPFPSPGNHPEPGIEPMPPASPALQADSLPLSHWGGPSFCAADAYTNITMSRGSLSTVFTGNETRIRKETTISS